MGAVDLKHVYILCSSPNLRGIHTYSLNCLQLFPNSRLLIPPGNNRILWLIWEFFFPFFLLLSTRNSVLIFANTRISPLAFAIRRDNYFLAILHDFMDTSLDCTMGTSPLSPKTYLNTTLLTSSLIHADCVVSNSNITRNSLQQLIPAADAYRPVLYPHLSFKPDLIATALENLRLPQHEILTNINNHSFAFFSLAGITSNKSPHSYCDLIRNISSDIPDSSLYYIIGLPPDSTFHQSIQAKLPRVTVKSLYRVSELTLVYLYLLSDAFISLSNQEGFGIPLHDALAFGVSSYVTSIPSFLELSTIHPYSDVMYFPHLSITKDLPPSLRQQQYCPDRFRRALTRGDKYLSTHTQHDYRLRKQVRNIYQYI